MINVLPASWGFLKIGKEEGREREMEERNGLADNAFSPED